MNEKKYLASGQKRLQIQKQRAAAAAAQAAASAVAANNGTNAPTTSANSSANASQDAASLASNISKSYPLFIEIKISSFSGSSEYIRFEGRVRLKH